MSLRHISKHEPPWKPRTIVPRVNQPQPCTDPGSSIPPLGDENYIGCAEWLLFSPSGLVGEIAMPKLLSVFGLALVLALAPAAAHAAQQGYLKLEGQKQGGSKGEGRPKSKALPSSNGLHQQSTPTSTATHHK